MQVNDLFKSHHKIIVSDDEQKGNLFLGKHHINLGNIHSTKIYNLDDSFIGAIITIADDCKVDIKNKKHLIIKIPDSPEYQISIHFQECFNFIDENLKNTNVLIHCFAGVSRSATITAAYMMKTYKLKAMEALEKIIKIRRRVSPNLGFVKQLEEFEKSI